MLRHIRQSCVSGMVVLFCLLVARPGMASESRGQILFGSLPVPGVRVVATQGQKTVVAISDDHGNYSLPNLSDGKWTIELRMTGFSPLVREVSITANMPPLRWEVKILPLKSILAQAGGTQTEGLDAGTMGTATHSGKTLRGESEASTSPAQPESDDGLLVNGSVHNAATSTFATSPAFGNTRRSSTNLYTGGFALILDNSALDARPYSLSGLTTPKPIYNNLGLVATLGGPIRIPYVVQHGPNFTATYEWGHKVLSTAQTGLVPTLAQRNGDLSTGNIAGVSPQAKALLDLYPLPNLANNARYNYQIAIGNDSHTDALNTRLEKSFGGTDSLYGEIAFQSIRADSANLFQFVDTTDTFGLNANVNWNHRLNHGLYLNIGYHFSRLRTHVSPYFSGREDISGNAGIIGNDQTSDNWGPPTLTFSSGIASLTDGISSFDRNRTDAISSSLAWYHGSHNVTVGYDFRRQEFNYFSQQNPRGTFTFTGAATGVSDFADFLIGVPDTSAIAFGNADKYLRQSVYDAYVADDWRPRSGLSLNIGVRWEYGAPITELKNRLVNLDHLPGFIQIAPVLATKPIGSLTGEHYPTSLIRPDKNKVEPRIGLSWRPLAGSSLVVRAGYGIYSDTSVYEDTALQMAQQSPLSKSLSVQNSTACALTLADGFIPCGNTTQNTFAVDPNLRVGYAQIWQLVIQKDLPQALQLNLTYQGIKGTRGIQEYLPNTYPLGAANPYPLCPVGFDYRTSNGSSTREAGTIELRRRLRSGFTATLFYTFSKSIDDDSTLGGQGSVGPGGTAPTTTVPAIAQNWLDLRAERSLSSFDQRHLLTTSIQYTTGMGLGGGTLVGGWRGRALKDWTLLGQITAGSGLPETPIYLAAVNGTGFTGMLRPDRVSAANRFASDSLLDANSYAAPHPGQWGNAGRNSIPGPSQFAFNASLARTFQFSQRWNLDVRANFLNLLNHAVFSAYNTTLNPVVAGSTFAASSPLFGVPPAADPMRNVQITARVRF